MCVDSTEWCSLCVQETIFLVYCCKDRSNKYRKWYFRDAAAKKPIINRLTQNLAWVDYVGDTTQYPKWHVNRFRGLPSRRGEC